MEIILYTTESCPRCKVLKSKLKEKGIDYKECTDIEVMSEKGFMEVPKLEIDGEILNFGDAIRWINGK